MANNNIISYVSSPKFQGILPKKLYKLEVGLHFTYKILNQEKITYNFIPFTTNKLGCYF